LPKFSLEKSGKNISSTIHAAVNSF